MEQLPNRFTYQNGNFNNFNCQPTPPEPMNVPELPLENRKVETAEIPLEELFFIDELAKEINETISNIVAYKQKNKISTTKEEWSLLNRSTLLMNQVVLAKRSSICYLCETNKKPVKKNNYPLLFE